MITTVGVPVTITPEAEEHVTGLGLQSALEQMLDFASKNFQGVLRFEVTLDPPCETDPDPHLMIHTVLPERGVDDLATWNRWVHWVVRQFQGDVLRHFTLWQTYLSDYEPEHGR